MSGLNKNGNKLAGVKPTVTNSHAFEGAYSPEEFIRKEIACYSKQLYDRKYVVGREGSLSARVEENKVIGTPAGISFGNVDESRLCEVDLEGNRLNASEPPREFRMYLELYKKNPECGCILHIQPTFLTLLSCRDDIDKRDPLGSMTVKQSTMMYDVAFIPFYNQGVSSVAHHLKSWENTHDAYLVANNGIMVLGHRVEDAYYMLEELEQMAKLTLLAERNRTRFLSAQEIFSLRKGIG
jgi:ribulose-5-phosphate 4-epimerase/fuculose-1-phosphate aldolase